MTDALRISREKNLDLIQVTEKVDPPVCKIMEFGKFLYWQGKKEKEMGKNKGGRLKGIRLTFNISQHDLETRAKQSKGFLEKGDKVRIEMILRGREKGLTDFAREKMLQFYQILDKEIPIKVERDLKREPRGFSMIIAKK